MSILSKDRLALLMGFAKVVLLDRPAAESAVREVLTRELVERRSEAELFRRLALACYGRVLRRSASVALAPDPLSDPLLRELSPSGRAELFLTLRCGFSAVLASSLAEAGGDAFPHAA